MLVATTYTVHFLYKLAMQDYFQIKHIDWLENEVILSVREDGLSDMEFCGDEVISITTEGMKPNTLLLSIANNVVTCISRTNT